MYKHSSNIMRVHLLDVINYDGYRLNVRFRKLHVWESQRKSFFCSNPHTRCPPQDPMYTLSKAAPASADRSRHLQFRIDGHPGHTYAPSRWYSPPPSQKHNSSISDLQYRSVPRTCRRRSPGPWTRRCRCCRRYRCWTRDGKRRSPGSQVGVCPSVCGHWRLSRVLKYKI